MALSWSEGNSYSNGNSFNDGPGRSTEPWWIRLLGPVQPGADPDGGMT